MSESENKPPQNASPEYQPTYTGSGGNITRFITPGGHPQDNSQPAFPVFHRKFANPAPLGLMSFGGTTILLSFINLETRHVKIDNVIVGVALFYGGLCQLLTGIMEFVSGNSFGTCAFTGYGAFWMSFAVIKIPWFGIVAAYEAADAMNQLKDALGLFLAMWGIVTVMLSITLLRSSVGLMFVFVTIAIAFFLLAAENFTATHHPTVSLHCKYAGGGFGMAGGLGAMYVAMAGLLTPDTSYFTIPIGNLAPQN